MTTPNADMDALAEPFKKRAEHLMETISREGLPFFVYETRRSFSRSAQLFMKGREYQHGVLKKVGPTVSNARAGESPHNFGLAADFLISTDKDHAFWAGHEAREVATGWWDSGYEKGRLVRPLVKLAWERYGRCVRACDLEWGGGWVSPVDLPHAQMLLWKQYRPADWRAVAQREVEAGR